MNRSRSYTRLGDSGLVQAMMTFTLVAMLHLVELTGCLDRASAAPAPVMEVAQMEAVGVMVAAAVAVAGVAATLPTPVAHTFASVNSASCSATCQMFHHHPNPACSPQRDGPECPRASMHLQTQKKPARPWGTWALVQQV